MNTSVGPLVVLAVLLLMIGGSSGDSVTQTEGQLTFSEGAILTINCTYTAAGYPTLFWYVQYPGEGPQLLLKATKANDKGSNKGFEALYNKEATSFHLQKAAVQESDSAVYYCALSGTFNNAGNVLTFGGGTRLMVKPHIKNPEPVIFQLSSKSNNLSACLFTDYESKTPLPNNTGGDTFISGETVLDMRSMDHKSNGVLAWSTKGNFSCLDVFNNSSLLASSDVPCDAKLVEQSFETDMNLNFQNLSVIGLRVLLLKVVGFNLLMTLRLWSS